MISDLVSVSSLCRARRLSLLLAGVLIATGLSVAPDPATGAGMADAPRASSVKDGRRHAGAPRFKAPKTKVARQRPVETWTPVSHSVSDGDKTRTTLYASPAFKQVGGRWTRLSTRVTRHQGRYPLRADGVAVPTWFGAGRGSLMHIGTGGRGLNVSLRGTSRLRPRLVRTGRVPRVAYSSVMSGVDLTYDVGRSSTKERIVIRGPKAPRSFTFLIADRRHVLGTPVKSDRGGVTFASSALNGFTMSLAEPVAYGSPKNHGKSWPRRQDGRTSAHQSVTRTRSGYRVRTWLDRDWVRGQRFPIVLDPPMVYSFDDETLATAFGPTESCSSDPLSSNEDGSAYIGWADAPCESDPDYIDMFDEYVHADLSNMPPWTPINSAELRMGFYSDTDLSDCWFASASDVGNLLLPGDSWDDALPGLYGGGGQFYSTDQSTSHSHPEYAADVTDPVRGWVEDGLGSEAGFRVDTSYYCLRAAAKTDTGHHKRSGDPARGFGITYDMSLVVDYDGPILPPPIPVQQSYGCACRWFHGADRVGTAADPVNTAAGQAVEQTVDVAQKAPGVPAAFARTYNGGDDTDGPLGAGWTFNFDASLTEDSLTGDVVFRNPSGGQIVYHPVTGSAYTGDPGARGTLVALGGGGWKVTSPEGETLTFNADGQLTSDTDLQGRGVTLGYTGSGSSAELTTITDQAGQVTTLSYGTSGAADGKIVGVETDDGRTVSYDYTTVDGGPHLTAIEDVTGQTTDITYDTTTGQLNGITDPTAGQSAQNVYDSNGRITEQTDANGETTTFDWQPVTGTGIPDGSGIQVTTDPLGNTTTDLYYGNVLIKSTDNDGNATSYTYDSDLNLVAVTDALGQVTTMTYDTDGNMLTRTGPEPSQITESWTYNGADQVTSHTDGRGKTTTYDYSLDGQLETVTDPLSHETGYTYDGDSNLATLTTPEGRTTSYDYDAQGNLTSQTSPEGHETTWTYDDAGNQLSETSANGNEPGATPADYTTTYTHDDAGRVLTSTDPLGTVTENTYDNAGRLATGTTTDADSNVLHDRTYSYDDAGRLLTSTDFARTTATNTYDERGQLASSTDAEGNATTYTYDFAGRRYSVTSPRGNEPGADPGDFTAYSSYDALGRLYATATPFTGPYGVEYSYSYATLDENGRSIANTTGANRTSYTSYDNAGNVLTTTDPMGRVTTRGYDDAGRLTSLARPDQDPTTYTYDHDGLRLTQTSPSGDSTVSWTYDYDARVLTQVSPRGNAPLADPEDYTTSYEYDAEGHTTSLTDPLGHQTTTTYDPLDNLLTSTDPRGKTTTWSYDAVSRITSVTPPGGADPTTYDYDTYGDLTTRTDALGHETTYTYDNVHQVTSVTDPRDRTKTFDYDADGNPITTVSARGNAVGADPEDWTITQDFDPSGRLMSRTTADLADAASYSYDADGQITGYTDAHGTTTQAYNDAGQPTEVIQPDETTYEYTYDTTGDQASRTYPNGDSTTYTRNDDGLIDTQTTDSQTTSYSYNPDQQITQIAYPATTDIVENRDYDHAGQISDITTLDTSGPTIVDEYAYTRDANGNPTRIAQTVGTTTGQRAFTYDDRNRLTKECPYDPSCDTAVNYIAYNYDDVGNRLQMTRVGNVTDPGTTTYTYDNADQLTQTVKSVLPIGGIGLPIDTTTNYSYDADGNLTTGGRTWNALNQMTASDTSGTGTTSYTYDALGNRISATTGSDSTALSWDSNNPLPMLAVTTSPDNEQSSYSYTPTGDLLQSEHPDETYPRSFHTTDALGSATDTFKTDGAPTVRTSFDAYGQPNTTTLSAGAVQPFLGYTGGFEELTGDLHLRARDYVLATGRFTSVDPRPAGTEAESISAYAYVGNQPLVFVDPTGETQNVPDPGAGGSAPPNNSGHSCTAANNSVVGAGLDAIGWDKADFCDWGSAGAQNVSNLGGGIVAGVSPSDDLTDWYANHVGADTDSPFYDGVKYTTFAGSLLGGGGEIVGGIRAACRSIELASKVKVFASTDAYVADTASLLQNTFGGVKRVNMDITELMGSTKEMDIVMDTLLIEVKSGSGTGITGQVLKTMKATGQTVIGYAPDAPYGMLKAARLRGLYIAGTPEELIQLVSTLR